MEITSTGAAEILLVEVPDDGHSFEIQDNPVEYGKHVMMLRGIPDYACVYSPLLPEGYNYTILGRAKELTKLECKSIVKFVGLPWCAYKDYTTPRNWYSGPIKSFHSLLESQGILLENPLGDQLIHAGRPYVTNKEEIEWGQFQSKVKNPLIIKAEKI